MFVPSTHQRQLMRPMICQRVQRVNVEAVESDSNAVFLIEGLQLSLVLCHIIVGPGRPLLACMEVNIHDSKMFVNSTIHGGSQ